MIRQLSFGSWKMGAAALSLLAVGAAPAFAISDDPEGGIEVVEAIVLHVDGAAETDVTIASSIIGNVIVDMGSHQRNIIDSSFNDSAGIMQVNQHSGNVANQANVVAIAAGKAGLADANLAGTFALVDNTLTVAGGSRDNQIIDSFNDSQGIAMVNQAAGNMQIQANLVSIAIGVGPAPDGFVNMGDVDLGEIMSGNDFTGVDAGIEHNHDITDSFNGFSGVALVNQTAGEANIAVQNFVMSYQRITAP